MELPSVVCPSGNLDPMEPLPASSVRLGAWTPWSRSQRRLSVWEPGTHGAAPNVVCPSGSLDPMEPLPESQLKVSCPSVCPRILCMWIYPSQLKVSCPSVCPRIHCMCVWPPGTFPPEVPSHPASGSISACGSIRLTSGNLSSSSSQSPSSRISWWSSAKPSDARPVRGRMYTTCRGGQTDLWIDRHKTHTLSQSKVQVRM
jgi:hypothetical protein